jgi:hypothetical protein
MSKLQGSPTSVIGERAEGAVLAALLRAGWTVLLPFGGSHAYDLVTEQDGQFRRVQVKHAVVKDGTVQFRAYSSTGKGAAKVVRDYQGRADLFGVYCSELDRVFLVPVSDVGMSTVTLRLELPKNGQRSGIRLADQYEIMRT